MSDRRPIFSLFFSLIKPNGAVAYCRIHWVRRPARYPSLSGRSLSPGTFGGGCVQLNRSAWSKVGELIDRKIATAD
jgi:hypothetical protein